jgi:hypothetical protein
MSSRDIPQFLHESGGTVLHQANDVFLPDLMRLITHHRTTYDATKDRPVYLKLWSVEAQQIAPSVI